MPKRRQRSIVGWIVLFIGLGLTLWGVAAIAVAGGLLKPLSIVTIQTPIATVTTDNPQFGAGLLLTVIGIALMYFSDRL